MAPRKEPAVVVDSDPRDDSLPSATKASKLPSELRFALVVLMSFSISALLYSVQGSVNDHELASISRRFEGWEGAAGVLGWKLIELGVSWFGGFDGEPEDFFTFSALDLLGVGSKDGARM